MTAFGATLKRIRLAHGVSQSALARTARFDHSYITRLESGDRPPTRLAVDRLVNAMALSGDDHTALIASAGFTADLADPDCVALANLLATVDRERGEWIRATVRNLIAMNAGGMG